MSFSYWSHNDCQVGNVNPVSHQCLLWCKKRSIAHYYFCRNEQYTNLSNKMEKLVLSCEMCDFKTTWKMNLKRHKSSVHLSNLHVCDMCDYKTTRKSTLNTHKKTAHEGRFYQCDICLFTTGWKQTLKRHKASKHEMKRYKCDFCDFSATRRENLKNHVSTGHLSESFNCTLCPFQVRPFLEITINRQLYEWNKSNPKDSIM